jgi:hypothetical protein
MGKNILEEAIADAKQLKEVAIEQAKNTLVEALSGKLKSVVENQLGMTDMGALPMEGHSGVEFKSVEDLVKELERLGVLGKGQDQGLDAGVGGLGEAENSEAPQPDMFGASEGSDDEDEESDDEDSDDEDEDSEDKDEDSEDKDDDKEVEESLSPVQEGENTMAEEQVVEVTTEDVARVIRKVLGEELTEATVTKSFGEPQDATIKASGGPGSKGLAGEDKEKVWSEEEPPAAKDWTVKEALYRKQVKALKEANVALQKESKEYRDACLYLKKNLQEVTLFNSKLVHTNKILQSAKLTGKQQIAIIEAFDSAGSMREVELVYKTLSENLKIAGVLGEGKVVSPSNAKARSSRFTTPSSTLLKESADRSDSGDVEYARLQKLAGLIE